MWMAASGSRVHINTSGIRSSSACWFLFVLFIAAIFPPFIIHMRVIISKSNFTAGRVELPHLIIYLISKIDTKQNKNKTFSTGEDDGHFVISHVNYTLGYTLKSERSIEFIISADERELLVRFPPIRELLPALISTGIHQLHASIIQSIISLVLLRSFHSVKTIQQNQLLINY